MYPFHELLLMIRFWLLWLNTKLTYKGCRKTWKLTFDGLIGTSLLVTPLKGGGCLMQRNSSGVGVHTLYFSETAAWNNFILYLHISLGGLFNIIENGDGWLHAPPEKLWTFLCNSVKCL